MEEKLEQPLIKTAVISMSGDIKTSKSDIQASSQDLLVQCMSGVMDMIICHAESTTTANAIEIIEHLKKNGQIVGTFIDEFRMNSDHFSESESILNFQRNR